MEFIPILILCSMLSMACFGVDVKRDCLDNRTPTFFVLLLVVGIFGPTYLFYFILKLLFEMGVLGRK